MSRQKAAARRLVLRRLIEGRPVSTQEELVAALAERGYPVTQTTVSRDLVALGAIKEPSEEGLENRYRLAGTRPSVDDPLGRLARLMREFVVSIADSGNLVVVKTPPGAASPVAQALDDAQLPEQLGTIGGDDTILIIASNEVGGARLASRLEEILEMPV